MSQSFVGEVRAVGFNFAPVQWLACQGQLVSIAEYSALFQLIGTTYGGDGQSTFALPNLQSRIPLHQGNLQGSFYVMGELAGAETVTINATTFPTHQHSLVASSATAGATNLPANNTMGSGQKIYKTATPSIAMNPAMVSVAPGGNQPHNNIQPYQAINWIISMYGIFPSQG